ncbi:MAG: rhomboid family intramembrane serine protease [Chloroflexi bacterium]|nr:rhomboid family intramembrane serine protease [Chloroflexota bacterium]
MLPVGDVNPRRHFPTITVGLILLNGAVMAYSASLSPEARQAFYTSAGAVPYRLAHSPAPMAWTTLLTSLFIHSGLLHLLSNMLYLWIFGDNVEDRLGEVAFILFYLLAGVAGNLAQIAAKPYSELPVIGASGAIAGLLGAYLAMYPHARVRTLVIIFYFLRLVEMPAIVVLGIWFLLQIAQGIINLGTLSPEGGVAWFAHIGGFAFGLLAGLLFRGCTRPPLCRYG